MIRGEKNKNKLIGGINVHIRTCRGKNRDSHIHLHGGGYSQAILRSEILDGKYWAYTAIFCSTQEEYDDLDWEEFETQYHRWKTLAIGNYEISVHGPNEFNHNTQ